MWIRSSTDYGRSGACKDKSSKGGPIDCQLNLSEKGRVRFQVELWEAAKRVAESKWTDYIPMGR